MKLAMQVIVVSLAALALASVVGAAPYLEERVTGGALDLVWAPGFGVSNNMKPLTLTPSDPGYANPSGDHTVACATNSFAPDSGGIILTCTDPAGVSDYQWEADIFTGAGNTRRGLVVRANPGNAFQSCYQFVIQSGLFQLNFRKLINQTPTTLGSWFATVLPTGIPQPNTWHHMMVMAMGDQFRCFWDGYELTSAPIVDGSLSSGWVGCYNFRFDLGFVPVYFDDLALTNLGIIPTRPTSWGELKARYRK